MNQTFAARLAGALIASCVSGAAVAQEPAAPSAPDYQRRATPALATYTAEVLFGRVWPGDTLSPRDRSLIVISALTASGKAPLVRGHSGRGLDNGLTPVEVSEIVTHLAFYAGWPNAVQAAMVLDEVYAERGITIDAADVAMGDAPIEPDAEGEAARAATVNENVAPYAPGLAEDTNAVVFGDLWRRPQLSPRDRSLVTVAGLIAMGQADQLPYHLGRAMDAGLTAEEAGGVIHHLAYYVGWPKAFSAVPALRALIEERG